MLLCAAASAAIAAITSQGLVIRVQSATTTTTQPYEAYVISGVSSPTNVNGEYRVSATNSDSVVFTNGPYILGFSYSAWELHDAGYSAFWASTTHKWPHGPTWSTFAGSGSVTCTPSHAYYVTANKSTVVTGLYCHADTGNINLGWTNVANSSYYLEIDSGAGPYVSIMGGTYELYHEGYYPANYRSVLDAKGIYWEEFGDPSLTCTVTVVAQP
jgi:hypothetical protein